MPLLRATNPTRPVAAMALSAPSFAGDVLTVEQVERLKAEIRPGGI